MAKKPEHALIPLEVIEGKIFVLRGHRVMLDRDLAELYGVETRALNQAVKRNRARFPDDFMFRLTAAETKTALSLRSQIVTLKRGRHIKYLPYVFTEHGAVMLANVLKTAVAVRASIQVVRAFVHLRQFLATMNSSPGRSKRWRKKSASTTPTSRRFSLCCGRSWSRHHNRTAARSDSLALSRNEAEHDI